MNKARRSLSNLSFHLFLASFFIFQMACSDSVEEDIAYQFNVFPDHEKLRNLCESPRKGLDISGRPFRDVPGTLLHELQWLRAWSNDTYLWYDELIDENPLNFTDPIKYFHTLKTDGLTPTGRPKDNFHFAVKTQTYRALNETGRVFGYGLRIAYYQFEPERDIRVMLVEPLSSAGAQGVVRGARLLSVDGIDLTQPLTNEDQANFNDILYPTTSGESHQFTLLFPNEITPREITLTAGDVIRSAVLHESIIDTNNGKVGYLVYNTFNAFSEEALVDSFQYFSENNIEDLILDLRYNGGGLLNIASELGYMIAGPDATQDQTFYRFTFNDKYPVINPITKSNIIATPFYQQTTVGATIPVAQPLPALNLSRVFVLTTGSTCSASEAVINGLRGIDVEVIIIGDSTCGKPYGFYAADNCGTTYFTIQFSGANAKGFGIYPDGFTPENATGPLGVLVPGCQIQDDLTHNFGDLQESLLKNALQFRDSGTCREKNNFIQSKRVKPDVRLIHTPFLTDDFKGLIINSNE